MSAQAGTIEACEGCPCKGGVCNSDCEIYQDLKAEYLNEIRMEKIETRS